MQITCSRIKCPYFLQNKKAKPCKFCKRDDVKFIKEDWSGFSNHLTKVFNKMIEEEYIHDKGTAGYEKEKATPPEVA